MSKWVAANRTVSKKDWREIAKRLSCCNDLLAVLHQDVNLSSRFKDELGDIEQALEDFTDRVWKKSLTKKERLEVYGK